MKRATPYFSALLLLSIAGAILLLRLPLSVAEQEVAEKSLPSKVVMPELPLLTACENDLSLLSKVVQPSSVRLKANVAQLVDIAWIDQATLLVRTESPGDGEVERTPIYIWPLNQSPFLTNDTKSRRFKFGEIVVFAHDLAVAHKSGVRAVLNQMETIAATVLPPDAEAKSLALPDSLLIPDFGVPSEGSHGHREDIRFYDERGKIFTHVLCPSQVYICNPSEYYLYRGSGEWLLGVATVTTPREAQQAALSDRGATDISVLTLTPDNRHVSAVHTFPKGPSLLSTPSLSLSAAKQSKVEHFAALDHPALSPFRQRWLFRKVESINYPGISHEEAFFAELWCCKRDGSNRKLLDVQGWYKGPYSHQYAFFVTGKDQVKEEYRNFKTWGAYREMIPAVSPDGRSVAYIKDNQICIAKVPQ